MTEITGDGKREGVRWGRGTYSRLVPKSFKLFAGTDILGGGGRGWGNFAPKICTFVLSSLD